MIYLHEFCVCPRLGVVGGKRHVKPEEMNQSLIGSGYKEAEKTRPRVETPEPAYNLRNEKSTNK